MLRLKRPKECPPILLEKGLAKAQELCDLYDDSPPHRDGVESFPIAEIYRDLSVRQSLERAQHAKCCYCDSKAMPLEVEHYRPKNGVRQAREVKEERPGYYWLAYEWQNLLVACVLCNQPRQDAQGEPTGKGTVFPLANPAQRARSHHAALSNEDPLLLDPYEDNPEEHIAYNEFIPHGLTEKGKTTIEVLKLCSASQLARPRDRWDLISKILKRIFDEPDLPPQFQQEFIEELWDMADVRAEYAAIARAALAAWGLPLRRS